MTFPKILTDIQNCLQKEITLSNDFADGRVSSIFDEQKISNIISNNFSSLVEIAPPRKWWDYWLIKENSPVNIKITTKKAADNACSILALLHCFSNLDLKNKSANKTRDFEDLSNLVDTAFKRDYYFIIIDKNTNEVRLNSLYYLQKICYNPSNLPFQINWADNEQLNTSKNRDLYKFLVSDPLTYSIKNSFQLRVLNKLNKNSIDFILKSIPDIKTKELLMEILNAK